MILECDHVVAVANGGRDDIFNLITSCVDCNAGKGVRSLSDQTTLSKQIAQMAELQERREQIEMMVDWRAGLETMQADAINRIAEHWKRLCEDSVSITPTGKDLLRKLIKKHDADLVLRAMSEALDSYGKRDKEHKYTRESIFLAFDKVAGVCRVIKASVDKPYYQRIYYIRGILRNRLDYVNEHDAFRLMERAAELDVDFDSVQKLACTTTSWSRFKDSLLDFISEQVEEPAPSTNC